MRYAALLRRTSLVVLLVLTGAGGAAGQDWTLCKPATSPSARVLHAMAYDAARQQVILFGGFTGLTQMLNDTWVFDGTRWTQLLPRSSPPARIEHSMVYDSHRQRIVLYGGNNGSALFTDTWEWDGITWTQVHPKASPPVAWQELSYDVARRRVVLFGKGQFHPQTTWEWDGAVWTLRLPKVKPPGRTFHAMSYDAARQRVVLFGGYFSQRYFRDTWEWDGISWTQRLTKVSPPARTNLAMIYDSGRKRTLLYGGFDGSQILSDTWEWDGRTWSKQTPSASPPARSGHAMAHDVGRRRVVMFGGSGTAVFGDTWEYSGLRLVASGTPRPGSTVVFMIEAPGSAGRYYQLGSSLGTGPIPIDNRWLDLSPDHLLVASASGSLPWIFFGYRGVIDSVGRASASLNLPNLPTMIGTRVNSAVVSLDARAPSGIWSISNVASFTIRY